MNKSYIEYRLVASVSGINYLSQETLDLLEVLVELEHVAAQPLQLNAHLLVIHLVQLALDFQDILLAFFFLFAEKEVHFDFVFVLGHSEVAALFFSQVNEGVEDGLRVEGRKQVCGLAEDGHVLLDFPLGLLLVLALLFVLVIYVPVLPRVLLLRGPDCGLSLQLGLGLLSLFLNGVGVDQLLPQTELFLHVFQSGHGPLCEPGMVLHLLHRESLVWVILQHRSYQVFELFAEESLSTGLVSGVGLPEHVSPVDANELVEGVFGRGLVEGRVLREHNEEDDATSKQVNRGAFVAFLHMNFGRHVAFRAELCLEHSGAIPACNGRCEPEICNLQVEDRVVEHILGLQVPVSDAMRVHVVQAINQLPEVKASDRLREAPPQSHVVEELAPRGQLQHNVDHLLLLAALLKHDAVLVVLYQIHNVRVVQLTHRLHLRHHQLQELVVQIRIPLLQYLHCIVDTGGFVNGEFDLGIGSGSKGFDQRIFS